jgi:hypothetical protein
MSIGACLVRWGSTASSLRSTEGKLEIEAVPGWDHSELLSQLYGTRTYTRPMLAGTSGFPDLHQPDYVPPPPAPRRFYCSCCGKAYKTGRCLASVPCGIDDDGDRYDYLLCKKCYEGIGKKWK